MTAVAKASGIGSGWRWLPLEDCCTFHNGLWTGKKPPFETATVIRNTNFTADGTIDLSDVAVLEVEAKQLSKRRLLKGDIIIEKSGGGPKQPVGRVVLFDIDEGVYSFSNFTSVIRVKDQNQLDPRYLHRVLYWWYVGGRTEPLQRRSTGIRNLDFSAYQCLEVPIPPLEEQKRIVAVLDQAFAALDRARALAEANLADAEELLAEARETMLDPSQTGWAVVPLSELIRIKHGFAFKSEYFTDSGDMVLLTPGNFFEGGGYRDRGSKQKYYEGVVPIGFVLQRGDLLMAMTEQAPGLLGSCILVPEDGRFLHNQRLGLIQPQSKDWHSPYFAHVFNTKAFRKALSDSCTGIKVRHTSPDKIMAVSVPVPASRDEQVDVAAKLDALVDKVRSLKDDLRLKLGELADLRQSLLWKAFAGELT